MNLLENGSNRLTGSRLSFEHLSLLFSWLDSRIEFAVARFRHEINICRNESSLQQLYITHEEVDYHLQKNTCSCGQEWDETTRLLKSSIQEKIAAVDSFESVHSSILPLTILKDRFQLNEFEFYTLIICVAPEFDRKYDRLYAYLQDDVTRKRPSIDLILDLLCDSVNEKNEKRSVFSSSAPLCKYNLLQEHLDTQSPSGSSFLARFMRVDISVLGFCSGYFAIEPPADSYIEFIETMTRAMDSEDHCVSELAQSVRYEEISEAPLHSIQYIRSSNITDASQLVKSVCTLLGKPLISVHTPLLLSGTDESIIVLGSIFRCAKIHDALIAFEDVDFLENDDDRCRKFLYAWLQCIGFYNVISFATGTNEWYINFRKCNHPVHQTFQPAPDFNAQKKLWLNALGSRGKCIDPSNIDSIAALYSLSQSQIFTASDYLDRNAFIKGEKEINTGDIVKAARTVMSRSLVRYGIRIQPALGWNEIVLPPFSITQLEELCRHARYSFKVFNEWGFGSITKHNRGLNALLFGPPGTGKTMAAEVIANELNCELYKVDLSMVVSKYIGETEKNLGAVFSEAQNLNAVLFFDEADALFGRRTEINDSHDRYANIQVSYLLQKIDSYEGIVLLASNYKGNIDEAFTRRFRFFIEMPFPDACSRKTIWKKQFPPSVPVEPDLHLDELAEKYSLSGGSIKNAALRAAFLAASQNTPINYNHLLYGIQQEYQKMGKTWIEPAKSTNVFRRMPSHSGVMER